MHAGRRSTQRVREVASRGVSFEATLADLARRSQRRAWGVAWCAVAMALLMAGGWFLFLPLKEKVPYLVMADPHTGTASLARLHGDLDDIGITREEAINKSNVAQFVRARESYDSGLVGQRNWRTVLSMAGPRVAPAYMALHAADNPRRPAVLYGAGRSVHVRILSILLVGGQGGPYTGATVRFQRSLYDKGRGRSEPIDGRIATIEFSYNANLKLGDEDRLLNPLGFRVTDYRVESDHAAAPPPPPPFPDPAALSVEPVREAVGTAAVGPGAGAGGSP